MLCHQFIKARDNYSPEKLFYLSKDQQKWVEYQQLLLKTKPLTNELSPTNRIRITIYRIVTSSYFDMLIVFCILGNIIVLALNYDGSSKNYELILDLVNYLFTIIFSIELLLKLFAYGPSLYFECNWNKLDVFIVVISLFEIIFSRVFQSSHSFLRVGPQIMRVFRVLRVTRILKLIKKLNGLQKLIETLIVALPSILNLGGLYVLVFFIYAILGVFFFQDIGKGKAFDEYNNFNNVFFAFVLLFRMVTGENWWMFMFDCFNYGITNKSIVFFF